jgi:hypothetical protein
VHRQGRRGRRNGPFMEAAKQRRAAVVVRAL